MVQRHREQYVPRKRILALVRTFGIYRGLTWSSRYSQTQKTVAKIIKKSGISVVDVIDFGCGQARRDKKSFSPTAEVFKNLLQHNGIRVFGYAGIDPAVDNSKVRGIDYVRQDAQTYLESIPKLKQNLVVALRLREHLPEFSQGLFQKNLWEKLPENGFLLTDAFLAKTTRLFEDTRDEDNVVARAIVLVRKVKGQPVIMHLNVTSTIEEFRNSSGRKRIAQFIESNYDPTKHAINCERLLQNQ